MTPGEGTVCIGRITGVYGIKGWVRLVSYTEPPDALFDYSPWYSECGSEPRPLAVAESRVHGKGFVARLNGVADRDAAAALIGRDIAIRPDQLAPLTEGEYYWTQLIGLRVVDREGRALGAVDHLIETGANDVLVVRDHSGGRAILIPYLPGQVIEAIDLDSGVMRVDWESDM